MSYVHAMQHRINWYPQSNLDPPEMETILITKKICGKNDNLLAFTLTGVWTLHLFLVE